VAVTIRDHETRMREYREYTQDSGDGNQDLAKSKRAHIDTQ
jgi:hypothetical protein